MLERKVERLKKASKSDKSMQAIHDEGLKLLDHLNAGKLASIYENKGSENALPLFSDPGLVSDKKVIYCGNVDEDGLLEDNEHVKAVQGFAKNQGNAFVKVSAQVEQEIVGLDDEEQLEFLKEYGVTESGMEQVIKQGFDLLGLQSYFTAGVQEVRAWTINKGWKAPKAASVIHNDFEKGFIRAEVIAYNDFITHGSEAKCRTAGVLKTEGKEYIVNDGDVMHFLFNA